jgi:hypothetical protein
MSMHAKLWISHLRKFLRFKKSPLRSPRMMQVAAVSVVVLITVAGLVLAAHQAVLPAPAPRAVKAVATKANTTAPAPAQSPVKKNAPANAHANASANASAAALTAVTITGCLEQNHDSFRLKDTSGTDAPKSRSWKTGFMTKHAKTITVVDSGNRLKLGSHVGERVSVTGVMGDKDMQGRSLKSVASSCD